MNKGWAWQAKRAIVACLWSCPMLDSETMQHSASALLASWWSGLKECYRLGLIAPFLCEVQHCDASKASILQSVLSQCAGSESTLSCMHGATPPFTAATCPSVVLMDACMLS